MAVELVTVVDRVRDTVGDGVISHSCKVRDGVSDYQELLVIAVEFEVE